MILTDLPDLPPRPLTLANSAFRQRFYARWGRENAVICGSALQAEYAVLAQSLSIKLCQGGAERYLLPQRELLVDDDSLLVLNQGQRYGSCLQPRGRPVWSFALFLRPDLQAEVRADQITPLARALDAPADAATPSALPFSEHLRPRQGALSERMLALAAGILGGERDEDWLEQQAQGVLRQLLSDEHAPRPASAARPRLQAELQRRLRRAADCIESAYAEPLSLAQLAEVACLSRCHFVRAFGQHYGLSPHAYLMRKRARVAAQWLASGEQDRECIALRCGLGSRWTMQRALARYAPQTLQTPQRQKTRNSCTAPAPRAD